MQRPKLRLDRARHCAVRPDSTFGKGMFVPFDWRLELAETGELRADLLEVGLLSIAAVKACKP